MEEEVEVYLVNGQRYNVTDWPQQYKILWLSENLDAKKVEPEGDEIKIDTSIFGIPGGVSSKTEDTNAGYEEFDLTSIINTLYSDEIKKFDAENPVTDMGFVETLLGGSVIEGNDKFEANQITEITDRSFDEPWDADLESSIINAALNPKFIKEDYTPTGVQDEIIPDEREMYSQPDVSKFKNQPSITAALDEGLITKHDLTLGMYPGYTGWVDYYGDKVAGAKMGSGITLPDGRELTNAEVYKIMWQNDMPYDTNVEKLKRRARNKVNRFVLQDANQIQTIIDASKLNQPYIFEDQAVEDTFVNDVFNEEALSLDEDFNIKDFNGFLNGRGYREDLERSLELLKDNNDENSAKVRELLKLDYLNLYINEQLTRDLLQQKLQWEKNNPGRDADTEDIQFYYSKGNLDPANIKKWMKTETPYVYNQLEKNQIDLEKRYQDLLNTGGDVTTGEFLKTVGSNSWIGFWNDAIQPFFTTGMDFLPGESGEKIAEKWRNNSLIRNFERGDQLRYAYKRGKVLQFPEYGNVTYLVTEDGRIFDTTNKIEATGFLTPEQQEKIINRTREKGKFGSSTSSLGLAFESSRVIGDLFFQIGLTWGIGKLKYAVGGYTKGMGVLGRTKAALRNIPVKSVIADAMIAQGTIGLTRGYEQTLLAARQAGINESDARELASSAALQTGAWYTMTAPISPQTKAKNLIFGKPIKETVETAVSMFKREGWKGWANHWKKLKNTLSTTEGLKQIGKSGVRNLDMMQREGWKELFQENIQQVGETTSIGANLNVKAGQQILKENYTLEDFIHTSQISFIAGFLMPGGGKVLNSSKEFARDYYGMNNVDRFNALTYMSFKKNEVEKLLGKQLEDGLYTQEEIDGLLGEIDQFSNTINHLPPSMSAKSAKTVLESIELMEFLEQEKKSVGKAFQGVYESQIAELDTVIKNTYYDEVTGAQRAGILAAAKAGIAGNTIFKPLSNEQEALDYLKSVIQRRGDQQDLSEKEFEKYLKNRFFDKSGGAMFIQDGVKYALEFKWKAARAPRGGAGDYTAAHEFKHALWAETIKDDPETQKLLGRALMLELAKMDLDLDDDLDDSIIPEKFRARWKQYFKKINDQIDWQKRLLKEDPTYTKAEFERKKAEIVGNFWEEAMILYSEAVGNKWVKYDEDVADRFKNTWRRAMQFIGATDFEFDSGKKVFNMIKDYNAAVDSGMLRWNRAFKKMGTKGAKVDKKKLKEELEVDEETKTKIDKKSKRREKRAAEETEKARKMLDEMMSKRKAKATPPGTAKGAKNIKDENQFDDKFSLIEPRTSSEDFKNIINNLYNKDIFSTEQGIDEAAYNVILEYEDILRNKIWLKYAGLPNISIEMILKDTQLELLKHVRNFNRQFLKERQKYKDSLEKKGLSKKEIDKRLETQDRQGYKITTGKKKGEIITENLNLNAWINSQIDNRIKTALKKPGRTTTKFTQPVNENITGNVYENSDAEKQALEWEKEQGELAFLLEDPLFGFVNTAGEDIIIDTIPIGGEVISGINDPTLAVNIRLATEKDPKVIEDLQRQKRNLERGLELEAKENLTKEERKELESLRDYVAYDLGSGRTQKTFEAFILPQSPAKIIIKQVQNLILRSPNIETLEFRNFKKFFDNFLYPLARKMTFKNKEDIDFFMYDNWKTIYDVINNPYDPITGKSTYSQKMIPNRLKAFNEEGDRIKKKDVTRALFLQSFFGRDEAVRIIKKYNKRPNKELDQLLPKERHPKGHKFAGQLIGTKEDGSISFAFFDRRTKLMRLFGDVVVLQEARRALRNELFLTQLAERNPSLAADLNDSNTMQEIINDLATGKTTSVKFSLNDDLAPFMKGRSIDQQIVLANIIEKAALNTIIKSKDQEIKNSILFEVPNLENLNDKATALYLINKVAEGYNNFKFLNNKNSKGKITKEVLKGSDVKFSQDPDFNFDTYSNDLSKGLNEILAETSGISPDKIISEAQITGKGALGSDQGQWWKYGGMYSASDMDLKGLLFMLAYSKGKKGEQQLKWLKDNVLIPYHQGNINRIHEKAATLKNWTALQKEFKKTMKRLNDPVPGMEGFVVDDALRVYLWSQNGGWAMGNRKIPGLSQQQKFNLKSFILEDENLLKFAVKLSKLSKQPNGWLEPYENWKGNNIQSEIINNMVESSRAKHLAKYLQNIKLIFNKDNLNKIQSIHGKSMREALESALYRTQYGKNEPNKDKPMGSFMHWMNNSIGVTMFTNMRSAMLQSISMLNYINTSDNNILQVGARMMDVKQFMDDFLTLWASGYLTDRRGGMLTNLQEQEIVALANDKNHVDIVDKFNAMNAYLLKIGFIPTRIMDSFAIAFGGAAFYRNRINTYKKDGYSDLEANEKAYFDWYVQSEEVQQSGDPSKISLNQASQFGRLVMAFQNTPLQYGRVMKMSAVDLAKGRGNPLNHIGKIAYYGGIQYAMFSLLQNALIASLFGWDDEEELRPKKYETQWKRFYGNWVDSLLKGQGLVGNVMAWAKNVGLTWWNLRKDKKAMYKEADLYLATSELLVPLNIKLRDLKKAYREDYWNQDDIRWDYEGKGWIGVLTNPSVIKSMLYTVQAASGAPTGRIMDKYENLNNMINLDIENWQRIMLFLGYNTWNLGIPDVNTRKGRNDELDFSNDINFDGDFNFSPNIKF